MVVSTTAQPRQVELAYAVASNTHSQTSAQNEDEERKDPGYRGALNLYPTDLNAQFVCAEGVKIKFARSAHICNKI